MLLVDTAHKRSSGWQDLVDEDKDGFLGAELDSLADYIDELADCQICWDEILLLVDSSDVRFLNLLADDLGCMLAVCADGQASDSNILECGRRISV